MREEANGKNQGATKEPPAALVDSNELDPWIDSKVEEHKVYLQTFCVCLNSLQSDYWGLNPPAFPLHGRAVVQVFRNCPVEQGVFILHKTRVTQQVLKLCHLFEGFHKEAGDFRGQKSYFRWWTKNRKFFVVVVLYCFFVFAFFF